MARILTAVVVILILYALIPIFADSKPLDTLDKISSVGSFVLAAVLAVAAWQHRPGRPPETPQSLSSLAGARRRYLRWLTARNHDIDIRGLGTQGPYSLSVDQVFVDVSLIPKPIHLASGDPLAVATDTYERTSVWTFLRRPPRPLVIVGPPGSGKTTLLKHITLVLAARARSARRVRPMVPVLLLVRQHARAIADDVDISLVRVVMNSLPESLRGTRRWLERQLRNGRCVVMLDGLDEVADPVTRWIVATWVERIVAEHDLNTFVLTSRPYGYQANPLTSADILQVRPFTDEQISTFLHRWYLATEVRRRGRHDEVIDADAKASANDLLGQLKRAPHLYDLAVNPLLLTMIAHVHNYRGVLPGGRAELYKEICQVFLGARQVAKGIPVGLSADQRESVLRRLALTMMSERVRDLPTEDAARAIRVQLQRVAPKYSPERFLVETEQLSGLLLQRENGIYAFAHLTFQEYLAAAEIRESGRTAQLVAGIDDGWWAETILLFCANADAGPVVEECLRVSTFRSLMLALDCSDVARELDPHLRERLTTEIDAGADGEDPGLAAVMRRVRLVRKVQHDVERIPDGDVVVGKPITNTDFSIFLSSDEVDSKIHRPLHWSASLAEQERDVPVTAVAAETARQFGGWLGQMWAYEPLPLGDPFGRPFVMSRRDLAIVSAWARMVDWESLHGGAPEAVVQASAFLEELGSNPVPANRTDDELRAHWSALGEAFRSVRPGRARAGDEAAAGRRAAALLYVLARSFGAGDRRPLKHWYLGWRVPTEPGHTYPFAPDRARTTESDLALSAELSVVTATLISDGFDSVGRHWRTMRGADILQGARGPDEVLTLDDERIRNDAVAADAYRGAVSAWDEWTTSVERDCSVLERLRENVQTLHLAARSIGDRHPSSETLNLLDQVITLEWQAKGLAPAGTELWLRRL